MREARAPRRLATFSLSLNAGAAARNQPGAQPTQPTTGRNDTSHSSPWYW